MSQKILSGLNKKDIFGMGLAILITLLALYVVYFIPKVKYEGKSITSEILEKIPFNSRVWQGKDVELEANQLQGEVYNFISKIFAREYENTTIPGQKVFLVILDAGNFHYPKVCFTGAGFKSEELEPRELNLRQAKLKVHLILNENNKEKLLSVYWICIDKQVVPTWAQQKLKQLYYSLFNKKRVGLMVRIDIPVKEDIDKSVEVIKGFIEDIYQATPEQYREYLFGL